MSMCVLTVNMPNVHNVAAKCPYGNGACVILALLLRSALQTHQIHEDFLHIQNRAADTSIEAKTLQTLGVVQCKNEYFMVWKCVTISRFNTAQRHDAVVDTGSRKVREVRQHIIPCLESC